MADQREELQQTQQLIHDLQEEMLKLRRAKEAATNPADVDALNKQLRTTALGMAEAALKANDLAKEVQSLDQQSARAKLTLVAVGAAGAFAFQQIAAGVLRTTSIGAPAEFELFQRAMADMAAVIGQMVVPALEMLTQWTRNVADYIANLDPHTQKVIVNFASFAVGLKLVATIAGPVLGALGALKSGVMALNAVLGATATGAILILVAGLLGLIARGDASGPFSRLAASLQKVGEAVLSLFAKLEPVLNFLADTVAKLIEGIAWLLDNTPKAGEAGATHQLLRKTLIPGIDLLQELFGGGAPTATGRKSSVGAAPVQPTFLSGEALAKKTIEAGLMAGGKTTAERTADAAEKTATETKEIKEIVKKKAGQNGNPLEKEIEMAMNA